jgi:AcrR family transcriptional regulator
VVEAAFAVIEAQGLAEFSTRKLAQRLGCEAMSIYHHFPSKAHLMDALVDRALSEMETPEPGLPFRAAMEQIARQLRAVGMRYPAFFQFLAVHRLNTPFALAWLDRTLGLFRDAGFGPRDAAHQFRLFGYYLMGAVLDETNGYARGPSSVQTVTEADLARDYPRVLDAAPYFTSQNWEPIFNAGLTIMMDGIEAALASAR